MQSAIEWLILLERSRTDQNQRIVVTESNCTLDVELIYQLAKGTLTKIQDGDFFQLCRALLCADTPWTCNLKDISLLKSFQRPFFYVAVSETCIDLFYVSAPTSSVRWIFGHNTHGIDVGNEPLREILGHKLPAPRIFKDVDSRHLMCLFVMLRPSQETTIEFSERCNFIFSELLRRGISIQSTSVVPLPFTDRNFFLALRRLPVSVPTWFATQWTLTLQTRDARDDILKAFFDLRHAIQVLIVPIVAGGHFTQQVSWQDQSVPLCLLGERQSLYSAILYVEYDQEKNSSTIMSPVPECLSNVLLNGTEQVPLKGGRVMLDETLEELHFEVEQQRIVISSRASKAALNLNCQICGHILLSSSPQEQINHVSECTVKTKQAHDKERTEMFTRIDQRLGPFNLERNPVEEDGYCVLRALLLAQDQKADPAAMMKLLNSIWTYAKQSNFVSEFLTQEQRNALLHLEKPEEALLRVSFSSSSSPSTDSAFESFWNQVYYWAAPAIGRDIYLLTEEATNCTLFSSAHPSPRPVSHSEVTLALPKAIALLHSKQPVLHIDWLTLSKPNPLKGEDEEEIEKEFHEFVGSGSPLMITSMTPRASTPINSSSAPSLDLLFSGAVVKPLAGVPLTNELLCFHSWDSFYESYRTATGKVLWYSRSDTNNVNVWTQHPLGRLPRECEFSSAITTVEKWWAWHQEARKLAPQELRNLYALVDIEVTNEDLLNLQASVPLFSLLDERSLHFYVHKCFPTLPRLQPMHLSLAPSLVPGAISTTPIHVGNTSALCYYWFIGFSPESLQIVDIYESEREKLGAIAANGTSPKGALHSVNVRAGEMFLVRPGQSFATKAWPSEVSSLPLVTLEGCVTWIGSTKSEAKLAIERMPPLHVGHQYLSMLACLCFVANSAKQDISDVAMEHLLAFKEHIESLIMSELNQLENVLPFVSIGGQIGAELWTCKSCGHLLANAIVWTARNDETYCLTCCLSRFSSNTTKRTRGDELKVAFRFVHPSKLLEHAQRFLGTTVERPPTPIALLDRIIEAITLRTIDDKHVLCKLALDVENTQLASLSKQDRERFLLANHDIPRLCHRDPEACPLLATEAKREQAYEDLLRARKSPRCSLAACKQSGTLQRPLYHCPSTRHGNKRVYFHSDCAGYFGGDIPSNVDLFCQVCLKRGAPQGNIELYRKQHVWEVSHAQTELYHTQRGFRCVQVPQDGLCFFTSLYMLCKTTSTVPASEEILAWIKQVLHPLMYEECQRYDHGHPLREAENEVALWTSRTLQEWRFEWDSSQFDAICCQLPQLLRVNGLLAFDYYRYSYDTTLDQGSWFDVHGSKATLPSSVCFALLRTETPIFHYTLLERKKITPPQFLSLELLDSGGLLNSEIISAYFKRVLAPRNPANLYLDPAFYTKLLLNNSNDELLRWFKEVDFERLEKVRGSLVFITNASKIFIPIHLPAHWCLVVVDLKFMQLEYYDSLSSRAPQARKIGQDILEFIEILLAAKGHTMPVTCWPIGKPDERPYQDNAVDCGVFVCAYARCRAMHIFNVFDFTTADIPRIREEMKRELSFAGMRN